MIKVNNPNLHKIRANEITILKHIKFRQQKKIFKILLSAAYLQLNICCPKKINIQLNKEMY